MCSAVVLQRKHGANLRGAVTVPQCNRFPDRCPILVGAQPLFELADSNLVLSSLYKDAALLF